MALKKLPPMETLNLTVITITWRTNDDEILRACQTMFQIKFMPSVAPKHVIETKNTQITGTCLKLGEQFLRQMILRVMAIFHSLVPIFTRLPTITLECYH